MELLLEFTPVNLVNAVLSLLHSQSTDLAHVVQQLLILFFSFGDASTFYLLVY